MNINKEKKEKRDKSLGFRVTQNEYQVISEMAERNNRSVSDFLYSITFNAIFNISETTPDNTVEITFEDMLRKVIQEEFLSQFSTAVETEIKPMIEHQTDRVVKMSYKNLVVSSEAKRMAEVSAKRLFEKENGKDTFPYYQQQVREKSIKEASLKHSVFMKGSGVNE